MGVFDGQQEFIDTLRARYVEPENVEVIGYEETGAPFEHSGFGKHAANAKDQQRDFLVRHLLNVSPSHTT